MSDSQRQTRAVRQQEATQSETSGQSQRTYPKIWMVILLALVAIVFTALWLGVYEWLNKVIWNNSFVTSNKWTIPVGVLFFSLLVGLVQKYLLAPTVINGGAMASMKGGGKKRQITRPFRAHCSHLFSHCSLGRVSGLKEPWVLRPGYHRLDN